MSSFKIIGGARIGVFNATYPFASLRVIEDELYLKVFIIGDLVFKPHDIISIETYRIFPLVGEGIKISHTNPKYENKIIFWTFKSPIKVLKMIKSSNFYEKRIN